MLITHTHTRTHTHTHTHEHSTFPAAQPLLPSPTHTLMRTATHCFLTNHTQSVCVCVRVCVCVCVCVCPHPTPPPPPTRTHTHLHPPPAALPHSQSGANWRAGPNPPLAALLKCSHQRKAQRHQQLDLAVAFVGWWWWWWWWWWGWWRALHASSVGPLLC